MKKTNFNEVHKKYGAKLVPFAGFEMPVQYANGILAEHKAVRERVGIFDVSHMGEVEIRGGDAAAFIQRLTVNDVTKLAAGKAQYSAMCYPDGGIVDDLLVYHRGDHYMLVINASNIEKDIAWMRENAVGFADLDIRDVSDEINLLAVQGPKSIDVLQKLTSTALADIPYYNFAEGELAGVPMLLSRTGYTGEVGFELYFRGDVAAAETVWEAIMAAGAEEGIEPAGLGARDTLRLEKGYCLYGNDIDATTNPLEAGLGWITKLKKGEFVALDVLNKVKEEGAKRKLVAFKMAEERQLPRHGYPIVVDGAEAGVVTSGTQSPNLGIGIGLGYVPVEKSAPGTPIAVAIRGKHCPAEVVALPFV